MNKPTPTAIRLSVTDDIRSALSKAKKLYPTMSDSEILKLGLSKIVHESNSMSQNSEDREEIK